MNEIVVGNCIDVMRGMDSNSVDLVFTSPPYYNAKPEYAKWNSYEEYLAFLTNTFRAVKFVLRCGCPFVLNVSCVIEPRLSRQYESVRYPIPFDCVQTLKDIGMTFIDDIIWQKPDGASNRARTFANIRRPVSYKPFTVTEYLLVFRDSSSGLIDDVIRRHTEQQISDSLVEDGYERTNVWAISPTHNDLHPAPFPLELATKVIQYYSFKDDVVFDPFIGSGTTAIAADRLGRNFYGCDISSEYVELAQKRLAEDRLKRSQIAMGI